MCEVVASLSQIAGKGERYRWRKGGVPILSRSTVGDGNRGGRGFRDSFGNRDSVETNVSCHRADRFTVRAALPDGYHVHKIDHVRGEEVGWETSKGQNLLTRILL